MFWKLKMMWHNTIADMYYLLLRITYKSKRNRFHEFIGNRCAHHTFMVFQIAEDIIENGSV